MYLDTKLAEVKVHIKFIELIYEENKVRNNKKSEEIPIEKPVKTAFQKLYGKELFHKYDDAEEVL